jgi:hypothetical protein
MRRVRPVVLPLLVALALVVAACAGPASSGAPAVGATGSAPGASGDGAGSPSEPGSSADASVEPQTDEPGVTPAPATAKPVKTPKPSASADASPGASLEPGAAADCTGNADNRTFFAGVAAQVDWTVVCAVLPKHWFVSSGTFRLAKGGRLLISYKGPDGATLSLSEGAWCTNADGCVPSGTDLGAAPLGPLAGTLIGVDGGGFAVMVDGGQPTSWLLETQGVDQATTAKLAAAAVTVGD